MVDQVEFCGELYPLDPQQGLTIGREGDLAVDENPFLHRDFLQLQHAEGLWWLVNVGSKLSATVSDEAGSIQAFLAPGGRLPLVVGRTTVRFSAGATTYELSIELETPPFVSPLPSAVGGGDTTRSGPALNHDQRLLLLALAERPLRAGHPAISSIPTSAEAARRLGWSLTRFNRKLDYLCQKLARIGVQGLHGGSGNLAANRRFRLVEYALAARLVAPDDLALLDAETATQP